MREINAVTPSYGGITHERVEESGLQWPCPTVDHPGTSILHVDLTAERIYSRSGTPHVSGQHGQIRYRQYVVGSGVVLGDTHGIDDVCRTRPSIQFRRLADIIRFYSTDRSGLLHRQSTDGVHELIVPLSSLRDEIPVFQARIKNVAHHAVQ